EERALALGVDRVRALERDEPHDALLGGIDDRLRRLHPEGPAAASKDRRSSSTSGLSPDAFISFGSKLHHRRLAEALSRSRRPAVRARSRQRAQGVARAAREEKRSPAAGTSRGAGAGWR